MSVRRAFLSAAALALLAAAAHVAGQVPARPAGDPPQAQRLGPAAHEADLPVLRAHRYRMAGRARPLLFWIGRDDVGLGEIVWRGGDGAVGFELLIGTDAAKAPRGINRWGYLQEEVRPGGTRVLGVMTTSDETTISDVTSRPAGAQPVGRFKGLDARIAGGTSRSATETIETERDFSVREKALIVERIAGRLEDAQPRDVPVPAGIRHGFLVATAELVQETLTAAKGGASSLRALKGRTIPYIYARTLYDLRLTGVEVSRPAAATASQYAVVHAEFGTLNRTKGTRTTFELDYAAEGPLAGVPTLIRHRPRWWLEAVLALEAR
jgi:hypothetical protein